LVCRQSSSPRGRARAASADSTCVEVPPQTLATRPRPCPPAAGGAAKGRRCPPWSPAAPTAQGHSRGRSRSAVWRRSEPGRTTQGCHAGSEKDHSPALMSATPSPIQCNPPHYHVVTPGSVYRKVLRQPCTRSPATCALANHLIRPTGQNLRPSFGERAFLEVR
jgi:hypothetical protein